MHDTMQDNLTNKQRDMLAKSFFYARVDVCLPEGDDASAFSTGFLSLMEFLKTVDITFDYEDFTQMCNWEPADA